VSAPAKRARQHTQPQRLAQKLGDVANIEPPHQIEAVNFNGADADAQGSGDFPVGVAHGNHLEDLGLPGREVESGFLESFNPLKLKRRISPDFRHGVAPLI